MLFTKKNGGSVIGTFVCALRRARLFGHCSVGGRHCTGRFFGAVCVNSRNGMYPPYPPRGMRNRISEEGVVQNLEIPARLWSHPLARCCGRSSTDSRPSCGAEGPGSRTGPHQPFQVMSHTQPFSGPIRKRNATVCAVFFFHSRVRRQIICFFLQFCV